MGNKLSEFAESIVQTLKQPLLVIDQHLRIKAANPSFCRAFEVSLETIHGQFIGKLEDGQWNIPTLHRLLREVAAKHIPLEGFEIGCDIPTGRRTFLLDAAPLAGTTNLLLVTLCDIRQENKVAGWPSEPKYHDLLAATQRQQQELALLKQARLALAGEIELSVIIRDVVEAVAETFGYTQVSLYLLQGDMLLLQHQVGYEHPLYRLSIQKGVIGRVARLGKPLWLQDIHTDPEFISIRSDIVSEICVPLFDEKQVVGTFNVESTDVNALSEVDLHLIIALGEHISIAIGQARLYAALRESNERYQSIVDSVKQVIFQIDLSGNWRFLNAAWTEITGFTVEESLGKHFSQFVFPDDLPETLKIFQSLLKGDRDTFRQDLRYVIKGGQLHWVEIYVRPVTHPLSNMITGFSGIITDITERKQVEEALLESNMLLATSRDALQNLIQQTPIGIQIFNAQGLCIEVNQAHLDIFGIANREQLIERHNIFTDPLAILVGTSAAAKRVLNGEIMRLGDITFDFSHGDSRYVGSRGARTVIVTLFPVFDEKAQVTNIVGLNFDITERKQMEEAIRRSEVAEREQRTLAEALRDSAAALTSTLDFEILMKRILENVGRVVPHDSANILLIEGDYARAAYWINYSTDYDKFALTARLPLASPILQQIIQTGEPLLLEDITKDPDWISVPETAWIRSFVSAPLRAHGHIIGFLNLDSATPGFFNAVHTERLLAFADQAAIAIENAQLYAEIRRNVATLGQRVAERTNELMTANERLQELDRLKTKFIADASHELRTPVTNLALRLHLLQHDVLEKRPGHLAILNSQVERLTDLLESILEFSRFEVNSQKAVFSPMDLNLIAEHVVVAFSPRAEDAGLELTFTPDSSLPKIAGDYNYLTRVVTNLVANAIHYTRTGSIHVRTLLVNDYVCLEVEDTGMGISPEDKAHLFERFYRGREVGSSNIPGAGLGLSIVHEIVTLHNGKIDIESQVGRGSTFKVYLPLEGRENQENHTQS